MKRKSPNWKEQELILVIDLYLKHDLKWLNSISKNSVEIIEMSKMLRSLDLFDENVKQITNFRSPSSVHMKLMNFKALDPKYLKNGLINGSILDRKIWSNYSNDMTKLKKEVEKILENYLKSNEELNVNRNISIEHKLKECLNFMVNYNNTCINIRKNVAEIPNLHISQNILNYTFKGLAFSNENIAEIEVLLNEINGDRSKSNNYNYNNITCTNENEKIGKYVQRTFSELIVLNILKNNDIKNLLQSDWSRKAFNINLPFLKAFDEMLPLSNQMKEGKYQRYWKRLYLINNKKYLVCKEWYESNRLYYNLWLQNINNEY